MQTAIPAPRILIDHQVLHRADAQGPRITRVQIVEALGQLTKVIFWHDNGRVIRIDAFPTTREKVVAFQSALAS